MTIDGHFSKKSLREMGIAGVYYQSRIQQRGYYCRKYENVYMEVL